MLLTTYEEVITNCIWILFFSFFFFLRRRRRRNHPNPDTLPEYSYLFLYPDCVIPLYIYCYSQNMQMYLENDKNNGNKTFVYHLHYKQLNIISRVFFSTWLYSSWNLPWPDNVAHIWSKIDWDIIYSFIYHSTTRLTSL